MGQHPLSLLCKVIERGGLKSTHQTIFFIIVATADAIGLDRARFETRRLGLTVYLPERGSDVARVTWSHEPGDFLTIAEKNERRPQLHRERASEAASTAVFNLDMPHSRMVGERRCDDRLRGAAMAAPRSSKFDDGRPFQGIDVSSGDGLVSHVTSVVSPFNCLGAITASRPLACRPAPRCGRPDPGIHDHT
jgi:hypothetical protein